MSTDAPDDRRSRRVAILAWFTIAAGLTSCVLAFAGGTAPATADTSPQLRSNATWLEALNYYRATAGLRPVREDSELSRRAALHARYTVRTQRLTHNESRSDPNYTTGGDNAARNGLIAAGPSAIDDAGEVEGWMRAPFHALRIIDPTVTAVGFGRFDEQNSGAFHHAAVLYVKRPPIHYLDGRRTAVASAIWPSRHGTIPITTFFGHEIPNPMTSCPGFGLDAGVPIIANAGTDVALRAVSFKENGRDVPICTISGATYRNPRAEDQRSGRRLLGRSSLIVIPKRPLVPGRTYRVQITTSGPDFDEQFIVGPARPGQLRGWRTAIEPARVRITWHAPDDGGSPITRYRVDAPSGRFHVAGNGAGIDLMNVVPGGRSSILIRAENAAGLGNPVTVHLDVPADAGSNPGPRRAHTIFGLVPPIVGDAMEPSDADEPAPATLPVAGSSVGGLGAAPSNASGSDVSGSDVNVAPFEASREPLDGNNGAEPPAVIGAASQGYAIVG